MTHGWTAVRLIRWPAQQGDRQWCADRDLPRVLIVDEGHPIPQQLDREIVLCEPVTESEVSEAVERLAWSPRQQAEITRRPVRRSSPMAAMVASVAAFF